MLGRVPAFGMKLAGAAVMTRVEGLVASGFAAG